MAYACKDVDSLSNTTFSNVCVASNFVTNATAWTIIQDTLLTCCGKSNVHLTSDDCYVYCNVTTHYDTVMLNNCLLDTLDESTNQQLNYDCYPLQTDLFGAESTDTSAGLIATTWSFPDDVVTATDVSWVGNGFTELVTVTTTETFDYWGNLETSGWVRTGIITPAGAKETGSSSGPGSGSGSVTKTGSVTPSTTSTATGSAAAAKSSSKASKAFRGFRISFGARCVVALSVLAFVL